MRFNARVAVGLFAIAFVGFGGSVLADELEDVVAEAASSSSSTTASASTTVAIEKPTFTVSFYWSR